jgi:hypothetical protein
LSFNKTDRKLQSFEAWTARRPNDTGIGAWNQLMAYITTVEPTGQNPQIK